MARPGISVLLHERRELIAGRSIGVFTNQTGVLPDLSSTVDALSAAADVRALFSPEHGLGGAAAEGESVAGAQHRSGLPIHSLYGAQLAPTPEQLAPDGRALQAIVCDIQDVGCRFYTYAWTLIKLIEAAAAADVTVIVADRPNPIGGAIEGPGIAAAYRSLVGLYDVPIRHGLTIGELAALVNRETAIGCDLRIVPCADWRREQGWPAALPWTPPSPNMPTPATALVYPGTCLLEGVNVSVGRGTAKPFEWLGAPWIDGEALAATLNEQQLPGVRWRPIMFRPLAEPYSGQLCAGVQPHVLDPIAFHPVPAGAALVAALQRLHRAELVWNVAHFDRLAGSARLRETISAGEPLAPLLGDWQAAADAFRARVAGDLLYD
jgi:uncharacterized protein YbbC (DUF1343 family)